MLKRAKNPKTEDTLLELMEKCTRIDQEIFRLQSEKMEVQEEMLKIKIAPFKIGQIVLAEIPSGRSKKWQKCLLECENGILYLRPKKENGYSQRHFSLTPVGDKTYSDYLKEVK